MEDISKHKTINENNEYFSAYLIMARHNVYVTLNEISKTIIGKTIEEESLLSECKLFTALATNKIDDKNLPPQTTEKIIEKLERYFPFLRPMLQKELESGKRVILQPEDYITLFKILFKHLDIFHNYYSPAHPGIYKNSNILLKNLRSSFDASVRKIRDDMGLEEAEINFLRRLKKDKNDRKAIEKEEFEYKFHDADSDNISEKGLAYFICLFLEPKYIILLLKQLDVFKQGDDRKCQIVYNCYKCYSIRLPQPKLSTDNTKENLAMNILNELKHCPTELFNHISDADKSKFFQKKNISEKDFEKKQNDEDDDIQKLIRKEDKFPLFALSYIDYQELFEKLRFQVYLGNYYYKFYEKLTVDNKFHLRSLNKRMKAYGRIQDFDPENQPESWKKLCKQPHNLSSEEPEEYISQAQPHHHVNTNLIALASTDNLNKDNLFPKIDPKANAITPDFFLSTHELVGLLFYNYLKQKGEKSKIYPSEKLIFKHKEKMHSFFDDIIEGKLTQCTEEELNRNYGITKREVPDRLLLMLGMKEKINSQESLQIKKIEQMVLETNSLLQKSYTDEQKAKRSKAGNYKKEKMLKSGSYSSFLAKDMVFLQKMPETSFSRKITSLNFQVLQSSLAFYGREKGNLIRIFKQCKFFNEETAHPFLKKVCGVCINSEKRNNLVTFYQVYLRQRINYLNYCKNHLSQCHFLKSKNDMELKELAQKYKDTPVNLPRGLFKNAITEHFKNECNVKSMKKVAEQEKTSTAYLIEQYFLHCLDGDKPLDYYNFKRAYIVIDKKEDDRYDFYKPVIHRYYDTKELTLLNEELKKYIEKLKPLEDIPPTEDEQKFRKNHGQMHNLYKQFCDNEKTIRTYKVQDMMMFLMGKNLLFNNDEMLHLKLQDILFDNTLDKGMETKKDILSTPAYYEMKIFGKTIFQTDLKPKNYADFKRFTKDHRIPSLFDWFEAEKIEREHIEKELEYYDNARIVILEYINRFERDMLKKYSEELLAAQKEEKYCSFSLILDTYQSKYHIKDEDKRLIKEIRNSFFHTEYPKKYFFPQNLLKQITQLQITKDIECIAVEKLKEITDSLCE